MGGLGGHWGRWGHWGRSCLKSVINDSCRRPFGQLLRNMNYEFKNVNGYEKKIILSLEGGSGTLSFLTNNYNHHAI
ncbi:MAG: hypothetical protein LBB88_01790 [Planctomycetaceae bacterium]|nr:hypothetical protein [Planctomycetaceae bacterium]